MYPVFARHIKRTPRRQGQFIRGQVFHPRHEAQEGLRGLVTLDRMEVVPGPGAVHLQQDHKLPAAGIFRCQVEGDVFPGTDGTGEAGSLPLYRFTGLLIQILLYSRKGFTHLARLSPVEKVKAPVPTASVPRKIGLR